MSTGRLPKGRTVAREYTASGRCASDNRDRGGAVNEDPCKAMPMTGPDEIERFLQEENRRNGELTSWYPELQALIDAGEHELLVDAIIELEQLEYASTEELDKYDLDD